MKKRILAFLLALGMVFTSVDMSVVFATEATTDTTESVEPQSEDGSPQVGDSIWIKRGSNVYKDYTNLENGSHTLWGNYEVTIKTIITDENGTPIWYEYNPSSLLVFIKDYKYVKVENTSETKPSEQGPSEEQPDTPETDELGIPVCDCGYAGTDGLDAHSDECARKDYLRNTYIIEKSAEEIYADWNSMDAETQDAVLTFMSWDYTLAGKLEVLNNLIKNESEEIEQGDAKAISERLTVLDAKSKQLTSYEECDAFYDSMIDAYGKAFDNDVLLVDTDDLAQIDEQFDKIEEYLESEFGYTNYYDTSAAAYSLLNEAGRAGTSDNDVIVDKTVNATENGQGDFILELSSYATGSTREISKPADIVLVLDQSASMYSPVGFSGAMTHHTLYDGADENTAVEQYELSEVVNMFKNTEKDDAGLTYKDKFSQLGYLIAQSKTTSDFYYDCDKDGDADYLTNHEHTTACKKLTGKHDIFVIQYVEGEEKPWYFYRVPNTSSPSTDADSWQGGGNQPALETKDLIKMSEEEIGDNHFYLYKSQYGALYDSMTSYVDSVIEDNVNHKLAIVGFASPATSDYKHANTGSGVYVNGEYHLYDNPDEGGVQNDYYKGYKDALIDVNEATDSIWKSVNAVKTDYYGTCHYTGFDMAYQILNANKSEDRDQIVILFTDGTPSCDNLCAKNKHDTVKRAKDIKDLGAEVYTICTSMVSDADFMKYASSDYPNAEDKTNSTNSTQIEEPKYAMQVADSDEMKDAFGSIEVSATTVTLGEEAVMADYLTEYFILPASLTEGLDNLTDAEATAKIKEYIKVYTANYKADGTWEDADEFSDAIIQLSKDETGAYRTIKVTNFDYSENYISSIARGENNNYYGCKLIVRIPIDPNPDFLGGDEVITNKAESGIYDGTDEVVETFPIPDVNVKVSEFYPTTVVKDIYLSQTAALPEIMNIGAFTQNDTNYTVDGINNDYVDIQYIVQEIDAQGNPVSDAMTYTIPAGRTYAELTDWDWDIPEGLTTHPLLKADTRYKITITVVSTNNSENDSSNDDKVTIKVYKPEITFNDSAIDLGDTADYKDNGGSVVWKHDGIEADVDEMGAAPTLEYTYNPEAGKFTEDTPVKVTVTAKSNGQSVPIDQNITEYVTFYRDICDFEGCANTEKTTVNSTDENRVNFVVHIKSFDLVISKKGAEDIDENQSFIFEVTGPNGFSMEVMVVGNSSVTIKNLPVGDYTVKEITDWSWRYEPETVVQEVDLEKAENGVANVTFVNTRQIPTWLSGDSYVENWFGKFEGLNN